MNKKGFTLIEILAVIVIVGILLLIAVPAVSNYIGDSRKTTFIDTVKKYVEIARADVTGLEYSVSNEKYAYYIPTNCLETDNGSHDSPYGKFTKSYVVVTYDKATGKNEYYYTGVDETGHGIYLTHSSLLDESVIKTDLKSIDNKIGVGSRPYIYIYSDSCNKTRDKFDAVLANNIPERGSMEKQNNSINSAVVYPTGKTKDTVVTGDIVTIDTEEFYVVKHDGSDLVLLSHYNLNVGSNMKAGATEGIQDSEVKGWVLDEAKYGNVVFSSTNYWYGKVGTTYSGDYCENNTYILGTNCAYIYDNNSNLYQYVNNYKTYLEGKGASIKSARLLRVEEAFELGCGQGQWSCKDSPANAPSWLYETTYWLGSTRSANILWDIYSDGFFSYNYYYYEDGSGVRPVIVI